MNAKYILEEMMSFICAFGDISEVLMYSEDSISVEAKDGRGNKYSLRFSITEKEED